MFRWASKKKLVPAETYHGLKAVEGLLRGRSKARETQPLGAVSEAHVEAVLARVGRTVRTMIQVQLLAGMRPQDIRAAGRPGDVGGRALKIIATPWIKIIDRMGFGNWYRIDVREDGIIIFRLGNRLRRHYVRAEVPHARAWPE